MSESRIEDIVRAAHDEFLDQHGEDFRVDEERLKAIAVFLNAFLQSSDNSWECEVLIRALAIVLEDFSKNMIKLLSVIDDQELQNLINDQPNENETLSSSDN